MPVKTAAALLLLLCACSLRAPRVDSAPCSSSGQCDRQNVCYLGECRGRSSALSTVVAEVRPPNDSQLGPAQRANIDLHSSVVANFTLQPLLRVTGVVEQEQDASSALSPVPGASVIFTDHAPAIPDRVGQVTAPTGPNGEFKVQLPSSTWDVLVQPPAPLPPLQLAGEVQSAAQGVELRLPRVGALARVTGTLSAGGAPLDGAQVVAVDDRGQPISVPSSSADGGFALLLPPGPPPFRLEVGPGAAGAADAGVPAGSQDPLPSYEPLGQPSGAPFTSSGPLTVALEALPPVAVVRGRVVDLAGAGIGAARVSAASLAGPGWTLARSTVASPDGTFVLTLRAGPYLIEAAPDASPSAPGVSGERSLTVTATTPFLVITCPRKSTATGVVVQPDGRPAGAGYEITATRLPDRLLTGRTATATPTDGTGAFRLVGDAGRYRLEVAPPASTHLPRKIIQIELGASDVTLPPLQLSPPLQILGTVHGAIPGGKDLPVAGATVDFFAVDASGARTIFLGSGLTNAQGNYSAVVPDVPLAGLVP